MHERVLDDHGRIYWICHNSMIRMRRCWEKRKVLFIFMALLALLFMAAARALLHPVVLNLRIYSFEWIFGLLALWLLNRFKSRLGWRSWLVIGGVLGATSMGHWYFHLSPHRYLTLYCQYHSLDIQELQELPETDHERIQPLHSIRILARQATTEVEQVSEPYFARIDDQYRWTMSVEPSFAIPRVVGSVTKVISVSATTATPNFSNDNHHPVSFSVGEKLLLGKNSHVATIRSFGLKRFLSYQPADVKYVKDDEGNWVELVSLIRWRGFFFPRPEFGGVQVIRQNQGGFLHSLQLLFLGEGEWIPPEEISRYPYLRGQNLVPYEVGRYVAESFRFQNGFLAPFPGFHKGDLRIPDLPGDMNDQPFLLFFRFPGTEESKLYQYFALEPYEAATARGLNTSVLFPADNIGPVKACRHSHNAEKLLGVSGVADQVRASRKYYDWNNNQPVEQRPWIKKIDGKLRFMWLTTVVAVKAGEQETERSHTAGSLPEVTLTDTLSNEVVWMDPHQTPSSWSAAVKRELDPIWKAD